MLRSLNLDPAATPASRLRREAACFRIRSDVFPIRYEREAAVFGSGYLAAVTSFLLPKAARETGAGEAFRTQSRLIKAKKVVGSAITTVLLLGLPGHGPILAQRPRRPAKAENPGPVSVTRSATMRITIASNPIGLFDYLSNPAKLTEWFPDQAIFDPQIGGKYHFRWKNAEGVWSGVVTEFIRGSTLAFTWQPPTEPYETNVRIKLLPQDTGTTILELTHSGFTSVGSLDKAIEAWNFYLQNLKSIIEGGTDLRKQAPARRPATPARTRRSAGFLEGVNQRVWPKSTLAAMKGSPVGIAG